MLDDFKKSSVIYSFGFRKDLSWELEMAALNFSVFVFNPNMKKKASNAKVVFLYDQANQRDYHLFENEGNFREKNMILKMDVVHEIWKTLSNIKFLSRFGQIVLNLDFSDFSPERFLSVLSAFRNLNKTHQIYWVHADNGGEYLLFGGIPFPSLIEVTYVKRDETVAFTSKNCREDERRFKDRGEFLCGGLRPEINLILKA